MFTRSHALRVDRLDGVPWLRFHDLRHFANTQAIAQALSRLAER